MIYGNVMTYKYEDDKVDESGNSLLDEQGNPLTETKEITLVFNLVTLIKYKNYTGRDFLTDFLSMGEKTVKSAQKMGFDKGTVEKLSRGEETTFEDFKNSISCFLLSFLTIRLVGAATIHATYCR